MTSSGDGPTILAARNRGRLVEDQLVPADTVRLPTFPIDSMSAFMTRTSFAR